MLQDSFHVRKGDTVQVMKGRERGKSGKVVKVITKHHRAIVEKVNRVKRHSRPSAQMPTGGILEKDAPIQLSNLMLLCPKCRRPVRTGKKILQDGTKVRFCKKCKEVLD
ncbi:MAG: 50S ribosomal protein L24 [Deltaproteobacteria bacterium]|nr:50S ribosomal protein L24 [Deltaproteobacteria bacterium]